MHFTRHLYVSAYHSECEYIIIIIKYHSNQQSSMLKRIGPKISKS